jgi:sigma54-dependent transcription regulator
VPLLPPSTEFIDLVVAVVSLIPDVGAKLAALFKSAENWNYVPVGTMQFITSSFQVISNETVEAQIWDVVKEFGEDLWAEDFSSFANAHSLLPGNGYNSGVCGPASR